MGGEDRLVRSGNQGELKEGVGEANVSRGGGFTKMSARGGILLRIGTKSQKISEMNKNKFFWLRKGKNWVYILW
jgi:hypothetical protein